MEHLDDLRRSLRGYTKIHVICDNAAFLQSRAVQQYLDRWRDRIQIHFLPKYAPETNPVERVWWHFHETITRNHRCQNLEELLDQAYDWFRHAGRYYSEMRNVFPLAALRSRHAEVRFSCSHPRAGLVLIDFVLGAS